MVTVAVLWQSKRSDAPNAIKDAGKIIVAGLINSWNSDGNTASQMQFWTNKDNTLTQHMTLTKNGNLGIGTSSPSSLLELRKTTAGFTTSGTGNKGAVLTLHHEAQWESAYDTGGSTPDWLGAIDFSTGDASTGEGIRASIRTTVNTLLQYK